jgi:hypothetical protein
MTTKTQLQTKIQELEAELQSFKQQLNTYTEITIENASVGDTLEDGSIVLQKSNGLALLVAPSSTEVEATWSKEFSEVFQKLKEQGFNPSSGLFLQRSNYNLLIIPFVVSSPPPSIGLLLSLMLRMRASFAILMVSRTAAVRRLRTVCGPSSV